MWIGKLERYGGFYQSLKITWVEEGLLHLFSAAVISSFNIYRVRARVIIGKPQSRSAKRCTQTGARVRPERRTRPTGTQMGVGSPWVRTAHSSNLAPWVRSVYQTVGTQIEGFGLEDRAA